MKLTLHKIRFGLYLIAFTLLGISTANAQQNSDIKTYEVNIRYTQAPLEEVVNTITKQTGIIFSYNASLASVRLSDINVVSKGIAPEQLLSSVFANTDISYTIVDRTVVLTKGKPASAAPVNKENTDVINISGTVSDHKGTPLAGVTVRIKDAMVGTSTNLQGKFFITAGKNENLVFSYIGHVEQIVAVNNRDQINVVLEEDLLMMEDVVVIGYGTQSRRTLTSSIAKLDGAVLESKPVNQIGDGLKGKLAGVRIYTTNNTPGNTPTWRVRGGSSINMSNEALVLIDGVERDISGLNSNDIESIEVLKDAASAAIYGANASNGVIMITTKKGSVSKGPQIVFEASVSHQSPVQQWDIMDGGEYITTMRKAIAIGKYPERNHANGFSASDSNDNTSIWTSRHLEDGEAIPAGWKHVKDPLDESKTIIYQDVDYQKEYFQNSLYQNYYIGVNGGMDRVKYNTSVGYVDDAGIALTTAWKRFSAHGNTEFKITDRLSFSSGFDYSEQQQQDIPDNQRKFMQRSLLIPNTHRLYWDDGTPAECWKNDIISPKWYQRYYDDRSRKQKRMSVDGTLTWRVTDDLRLVAHGTNFERYTRFHSFIKENVYSDSRNVKETFSSLTRRNLQIYGNYSKTFNRDHNFSAVLGYEYQHDTNDYLLSEAQGGSSDKIPTLTAAPTKLNSESRFLYESRLSYFGRVTYDYKERYLFSATMRADASSRFAKSTRWGYFPSASAGWIVSDEPFMKDVHAINNLKARVSIGQTGNSSIGWYDAYGAYSSGEKYNGQAAILTSVMPNESLRWETTTQFNAGIDISFLNNRITLIADYYNKVTKDMLLSLDLPNTSGFGDLTVNSGKVRFYGVDLELHTTNVKTKNFTWTSDLTYSYNMNKVLKLPDNGHDRNRIGGQTVGDGSKFGGYAEGERLYAIWGYKVKGILETEEQADNAYYDSRSKGFRFEDGKSITGRKAVGDYEWVNREGSTMTADGRIQIDDEDRFKLGYTTPHSTGGINNTFAYKNLSLSIYLDYAIGHSVFNYIYANFFKGIFDYNSQLVRDVNRSWEKPGDNTKFAKFFANDSDDGNVNYGRVSDVMTQKADYLCIRDITLSYKLPSKWTNKIRMNNLTVFVTGNNLYYFTELVGLNPELGYNIGQGSTEYSVYPSVRKICFGAKLIF